MAIQREFFGERSDGVKLYRTFSDDGKFIVQTETGAILEDAVDVEDATYTYAESEEAIPHHTEESTNAN